MSPGLADNLIASRLLIVQSKRLMLASAERDARRGGTNRGKQVEKLRLEAATAQESCRSALLKFGTPANPDYWPVAYLRLIGIGKRLTGTLNANASMLAPTERDRASADVKRLEHIIDEWTVSMRASIAQG